MISAQTRSAFVARENRYALFRIMLKQSPGELAVLVFDGIMTPMLSTKPVLFCRRASYRKALAISSEVTMRALRLMILVGATILGIAPATAQRYDPAYPVCLQKWEWGGSSSIYCRYRSWEECKATAAGLSAMCLVNPYWSQQLPSSGEAFGRKPASARTW
jgi:uncharacterized protein DUF3551